MNIFRRLLAKFCPAASPPAAPPRWASFFTPLQYARFLDLVRQHFRRERQAVTIDDGVVQLGKKTENGFQQLGLMNLAQLCGRTLEKDWPDIIHDHFRTLRKSQNEQEVLEGRLDDFAKISELLAVRLWPEDYLADFDRDKFIHRLDLPGTLTALVYDLPSSVRNVTPDEIERWGRTRENLFQIGLENVRESCIPDVSEHDLGDGVVLTVFSDESFFVASHSLLLEDHPEVLGTFGTLVGVPHRHVMLAYPIEDGTVIPAIHRMIPIIMGMEKEGPGSISKGLYWYYQGEYLQLPYHVEKNVLHFTPPEEFIEVLNLLAENSEED